MAKWSRKLKHKLVSKNDAKFLILITNENATALILYIWIHTAMCAEVEQNYK